MDRDVSESDLVLQRVLAQTLLSSDESETERAADHLANLSAVVTRHRGHSLQLDPVVFDLVAAMLSSIYKLRTEGRSFSREMVSTIANSIWADEASRDRLDGLWRRLCEETV